MALEDVDEEALSLRLYTAGLPDPDLLVRTSGELRISNFLLWQLAYTEIYITPVLWPDFNRELRSPRYTGPGFLSTCNTSPSVTPWL